MASLRQSQVGQSTARMPYKNGERSLRTGMMPTGSVFLDTPKDGRPRYDVRPPQQGKPRAHEQALCSRMSTPKDLFHSILQCNRLPLPYHPPGTQSSAKKKNLRPESMLAAPAYNTQWDESSEEEGIIPQLDEMEMKQQPQEHKDIRDRKRPQQRASARPSSSTCTSRRHNGPSNTRSSLLPSKPRHSQAPEAAPGGNRRKQNAQAWKQQWISSALSAYQAQEGPPSDARHHRRGSSGWVQGHRRGEGTSLHRRLVSAPSVLAPSPGTLVRYDRSAHARAKHSRSQSTQWPGTMMECQGALEASYRQLEAATAGIGQPAPYRRVGFQDYIEQLNAQNEGITALDTTTSTMGEGEEGSMAGGTVGEPESSVCTVRRSMSSRPKKIELCVPSRGDPPPALSVEGQSLVSLDPAPSAASPLAQGPALPEQRLSQPSIASLESSVRGRPQSAPAGTRLARTTALDTVARSLRTAEGACVFKPGRLLSASSVRAPLSLAGSFPGPEACCSTNQPSAAALEGYSEQGSYLNIVRGMGRPSGASTITTVLAQTHRRRYDLPPYAPPANHEGDEGLLGPQHSVASVSSAQSPQYVVVAHQLSGEGGAMLQPMTMYQRKGDAHGGWGHSRTRHAAMTGRVIHPLAPRQWHDRFDAARPQSSDPRVIQELSLLPLPPASVVEDKVPSSGTQAPSGEAGQHVNTGNKGAGEGRAEEGRADEETSTGYEVGERRSLVVSIPHYHRNSGQSVCSIDTASTSNERR